MFVMAAAVAPYALLGVGSAAAQGVEDAASGICGRTEAVRDAILRKLSDVSDCANVTDTHLSGIAGEIILSDFDSITLKDGDFAGLSSLEVLYLHRNDLSSVPEDALDGLTGLEELYLYNNVLTTLPSEAFEDLSMLQKLELSYNSITSLPDDVFDGLSNLEELNLRSNSLSELPDGLFDGLSSLTRLNLNANSLNSLPEGAFEGLSSLIDLRLAGNPGAPFTFTAELDATEDQLSIKVAEGAPFDITVALSAEDGTLSSSSVTVAGGSRTSEAVTVTASGSSAVTVSVDSAAFPSGIVSEGIQTGTGESLTVTLTIAEFCQRTLAVQTAFLEASDDVSDCADVTDTHLADFSPGSFAVKGVTSLRPGDFEGMSSLVWLELSFVDINAPTGTITRTLPEGVFDGLDSLEYLLLGGNQLTSLPEDVFDGLTTVTYLDLGANTFSSLPEDIFDGLDSLRLLDLSFNDLVSLPGDIFDGLSNLQSMLLNFNELTALPEDVFDGLSSLTQLLMDRNELSSLPTNVFDGLPNIERLHVDDNKLTSLPDSLFEGLAKLNWLELHDNPGSPFVFEAELRNTDDGVVVHVSEGAPFSIAVTLSAQNATLSSTDVTVAAGSTTSDAVTVTPTGTNDVTISVTPTTSWGGQARQGIQTGAGADLIIAVNSPATGAPTISGTAQVGQTLTADTSGIQDADGLTNVTYSYQWLSSGDTPISGATESTYVLQASDATETIKVEVSFTDDEGNEESLTSAATASVGAGGL